MSNMLKHRYPLFIYILATGDIHPGPAVLRSHQSRRQRAQGYLRRGKATVISRSAVASRPLGVSSR